MITPQLPFSVTIEVARVSESRVNQCPHEMSDKRSTILFLARAIDKRQTIETLINEEALLLAKSLRDERKTWAPRIAVLV